MTARDAGILAAGHGTRMKSALPKVLHKVGGRSLLDRVIDTVQASGCERIVVVVGAGPGPVRDLVVRRLGEGSVAVQDPPLGTGHAVLAAAPALEGFEGDVLVTNADCPLLTPADLEPLFALRGEGAALALLGFEPRDGLLYGRLIQGPDGGDTRIVELKLRPEPVKFDGKSYLLGFALPNFFFHVTTAYDILRHKGVPIGKRDFTGG